MYLCQNAVILCEELSNKDRTVEVCSLPNCSVVSKYSQRSVEELVTVTVTLKRGGKSCLQWPITSSFIHSRGSRRQHNLRTRSQSLGPSCLLFTQTFMCLNIQHCMKMAFYAMGLIFENTIRKNKHAQSPNSACLRRSSHTAITHACTRTHTHTRLHGTEHRRAALFHSPSVSFFSCGIQDIIV